MIVASTVQFHFSGNRVNQALGMLSPQQTPMTQEHFYRIWGLNRYGGSHESTITADFFFSSNCSPVFTNLGSDGYPRGRRFPLRVGTRPSFPGPVRRGRPVVDVEEPHVRRIVDGPNRR